MSPHRYNSVWKDGEKPPARVQIMDHLESIPMRSRWISVGDLARRLAFPSSLVNTHLETLARQGFIEKSETYRTDPSNHTRTMKVFRAVAQDGKVNVGLLASEAQQLWALLGGLGNDDLVLRVKEDIRVQLVQQGAWTVRV